MPTFPVLQGDINTDVLVIGGGMAGLLTLYELQQNGVPCVLLEKERICGGATRNTTAKLTVQHGLLYHKLLKQRGVETAQKYYTANRAALERYRSLAEGIPCDMEQQDSYVYSMADWELLEDELEALQKIGCPADFRQRLPLPFKAVGAVKVPAQAQFHPLKFAAGIAKGLPIYENSWVRKMVGTTAVTDGGRVTAKWVIVATHFPFINKHGGYFLKLYQHRSYLIALKGAPQPDGMYADEQKMGLTFRNYGEYLLLGGGGHRTGKPGGNWEELRQFAQKYYPTAEEKYHWAAQDCMSLDGVPYIGAYGRSTPELFVATGFNKWGMTGAMVAAMLLCDRMLGRQNDAADVFDPARSIRKPQLLVNGFEAVTHLITPAKKRCPHLGCTLKWNAAEHSWDCPCHGSRFGEEGKVLDNPANGDLP